MIVKITPQKLRRALDKIHVSGGVMLLAGKQGRIQIKRVDVGFVLDGNLLDITIYWKPKGMRRPSIEKFIRNQLNNL